ncbi:hypothetical protein KJ855_04305 [Patescibacteria group bacterium]|nr:hypothetical protein [Patescibacteria group bacterium]
MAQEIKKEEEELIVNPVDKYLTRRNLIITCIVIAGLIILAIAWQYFSQSILQIKPNTDNVNIEIKQSDQAFTREKSPEITEKIIIDQTNVEKLKTRLKPNFYYQIVVTKDNYSRYTQTFFAEAFQTYAFEPQLFEPLINTKISHPTPSKNNEIIYLDNTNNYPTKYNLITQTTEIIEENSWFGVNQIIYSPNKTKVILKVTNNNLAFSGGFFKTDPSDPQKTTASSPVSVFYRPGTPDGQTTIWSYDFTSKQYYQLSDFTKNIAWLDDNNIIYEYSNFTTDSFGNPDFIPANSINTALFTGQDWREIYNLINSPLTLSEIIPSPTDPNLVLLLPQPFETGQEIKTAIHLLNIQEKNVTILTEPGSFQASWSPDGNQILFAHLDNQNNNTPTLQIYNIQNQNIQNTGFNTIPSKTHWINAQQLLVALPSPPTIPANYYSQTDYPTTDILYLFNLNTGQKTDLFGQNFQQLINVHNIFSDNDYLYFQDSSNFLFQLPVKP